MRHAFSLLSWLLLIIGVSACNPDVFVDPLSPPSLSEVTIEGDGGAVSVTIDTSGLLEIWPDMYSDSNQYIHYYDTEGELSEGQIDAAKLGKITFDNGRISFELIKQGNRLTIRSIENTYSSDFKVVFRLVYAHTTESLTITIERGQPLKFEGGYLSDIKIREQPYRKSFTTTLKNRTDTDWTIQLRPYLNAQALCTYRTNGNLTWVEAMSLDLPVLVYEEGRWQSKIIPDHRLNEQFSYYRPDYDMVVGERTIAPGKGLVVKFTITYEVATAEGTLEFVSPTTGRRLNIPFSCEAIYPVSYETTIQNYL